MVTHKTGKRIAAGSRDTDQVAAKLPEERSTEIIMPPKTNLRFKVTLDYLEQLIDWYGYEACGFLCGPEPEVSKVLVVASTAESSTSYRMDPKQRVQALGYARMMGWTVYGSIHTHPVGPVGPSELDWRLISKAKPRTVRAVWHLASGTLTYYSQQGIINITQIEYPRHLAVALGTLFW